MNTLVLQAADCDVTTRCGRLTLQAATPNNTNPPMPHAPAAPSTSQRPASRYDVLSQLGTTPAQISILELLTTSPIHKEILEKSLLESCVPKNINASQFTAMIGNLSAQQHLVFTDKDFQGPNSHHNMSLHIEVLIQRHKIKRVLIDNGSSLNLYTLKMIHFLGLLEDLLDVNKRITIKAYDERERGSKGVIMLPLKVGPAIINIECHVLDLDLPYNILLGRPWIHILKAVPSTYHQCLKFPHQGREVTIPGDPNPFEFCKRLEGAPMNFCPISEFAKVIPKTLIIKEPSSTIVPEIANEDSNSRKGKEKVENTKVSTTAKKVTFADLGLGE